MLDAERIDGAADSYLNSIGRVFAVFDEKTQDSGNVSYGVEVGSARYFVKTAGRPDDPEPYLSHTDRVALLRNAVRVAESCDHPALPTLHRVIESPTGPLLIYDWLEGELVRPVLDRIRSLPAATVIRMLDAVYELHAQLARSGWIAVDFYDGCLIYDFDRETVGIVDLDCYRDGPSVNETGRMFGSSRFMAPEEFEKGARIDARTTVFNLGRTAAVLLSDGTLEPEPFRGSDAQREVMLQACRPDRAERFGSVGEFCDAWQAASATA